VAIFRAMPNANEKKQPGKDQGNAIENETREADSLEAESPDGGVTAEESMLAEEYPDGGAPARKKS